jgi:hypothetical protein
MFRGLPGRTRVNDWGWVAVVGAFLAVAGAPGCGGSGGGADGATGGTSGGGGVDGSTADADGLDAPGGRAGEAGSTADADVSDGSRADLAGEAGHGDAAGGGAGGAGGAGGIALDGYGMIATTAFPPDPPKANLYKDNLAASYAAGVTLVTASRALAGRNEILTLSIANAGQTGTFGGGDGGDATFFGYQNGIPPHQTTQCSITVTKAGTAKGDEVAGTFSAVFPAQGSFPNGTRELDVTAGSFLFKLE